LTRRRGTEKKKRRKGGDVDKKGGKKEEEGRGECWRGPRRTERFKTEGESFNTARHVHSLTILGT
jgi:hypothetical protein